MSDKVQPIIDQAASAARSNDDATAAKLWRKAAETSYHGGDKRRALTLAVCSVASQMRAGDLDAAREAMRAVDELEAELPGMDGSIAESIRTKRIQLKTMIAEVKPAAVAKGLPEGVVLLSEGQAKMLAENFTSQTPTDTKTADELVAEVLTASAEPLTTQEIVDRATGVGVKVTTNEAGNVFFADTYTATEGEDALKAGDDTAELIRETLESVGLTTENAVYANGNIAGRVVPIAK